MARKKAWVYQVASQVAKHGADKAAWNVGWVDPDGKRKTKSCGPGRKGLSAAKELADKTHSQIVTGTYDERGKSTWDAFVAKYESKVLGSMDALSRDTAMSSLNTFARIMKPGRVSSMKTELVAEFVSKRRADNLTKLEGKPPRFPSPATINRDLRYIRAALRTAHDWGDLARVPKFKFLKVPDKLPTYCPPEHFAAIYGACDAAKFPADIRNVTPGDWWRALVATAYMTGWRIGQILELRWDDVSLDSGRAVSLAEHNKGGRDVVVPLNPVVIEHLRKLAGSFETHVFPWNNNRRTLWTTFQKIQTAAIVKDDQGDEHPLPKAGKRGGFYGFHDFRRGFATQNAAGLDLFELQRLMQHKSLETTRGYVNMERRLKEAAGGLYVPDVLKTVSGVG